jgi:hypothetical protein
MDEEKLFKLKVLLAIVSILLMTYWLSGFFRIIVRLSFDYVISKFDLLLKI